jgi:hypothetical protein
MAHIHHARLRGLAMLIIDGEEKHKLMSHLKILKLYYRDQMLIYRGLPMSNEYRTCMDDLQTLIERIGGAETEKDEN